MSNERDILKSLLIKEELELLQTLREKVLSKDQFTQEVAQVLSGAIKRAQKEDENFERVLSLPIKKGVSRAFSENKQSIIDGLLPIMGQLIRKTVSNSIKQFVSDINRTLELGFSTKALKWRWQAYKADITFAEMVFQKTIRYQVSEIFLINSDNGLLIEHVGTDDMLKDNDAISAMLSVIKEFIGDSLSSPDGDLQSAEMGGNLLFFSHGPKAFLSFVVKGSPTERFKSNSQKLIENVHADFSDALKDEQNYRDNDELQSYLRSNLVTKEISETTTKINWLPWVLGFLLIIGSIAYWTYHKRQQFNEVNNTLQSIDGLYVQSITRKDGKFLIKGLLDPMADLSVLNNSEVTFQTQPYISLDENIVRSRIKKITSGYASIIVLLDDGILTVSGLVSPSESEEITNHLIQIVGVESIINELTINNTELLKVFVLQNLMISDDLKFECSHNEVLLFGTIKHDEYHDFIIKLKKDFPNVVVNNNALEVVETTQVLIDKVNNTKINMPSLGAVDDSEQLLNVIESLQLLIKRDSTMRLLITGESDCHGAASNTYSQIRADTIKERLIKAGIDEQMILTDVNTCQSNADYKQEALLNVSFKITSSEEL